MLLGSGFVRGRYRTTSNARGSAGTERRLRIVGKRVSRRSSQLTCSSPNSGTLASTTVARYGGISWRPYFAAVAGAAEVLARSPIHGDLQAHRLSLAWRSSHRRRHPRRCWMGRQPAVDDVASPRRLVCEEEATVADADSAGVVVQSVHMHRDAVAC